jgi:hypothetical protein
VLHGVADVGAEILIPGSGTPIEVCDFERSSEHAEDVYDYGAGRTGTGYGLCGSLRGVPENIVASPPQPGALPGSRRALYFEREDRARSRFYEENPEAVGTQVYGVPDEENQDDFLLRAGRFVASDGLSITVRYFVDLNRDAYCSFALRSTGWFTDGREHQRIYPAVWLYSADDGTGAFRDLRAFLRVADFSTGDRGFYKRDLLLDLPDKEGWWTLGLAFSHDGDVHYFASPGSDELTPADYLTSGSVVAPGYWFVENLDAVVMISTSNFCRSNPIQTMDDIQVYVNPLVGSGGQSPETPDQPAQSSQD